MDKEYLTSSVIIGVSELLKDRARNIQRCNVKSARTCTCRSVIAKATRVRMTAGRTYRPRLGLRAIGTLLLHVIVYKTNGIH